MLKFHNQITCASSRRIQYLNYFDLFTQLENALCVKYNEYFLISNEFACTIKQKIHTIKQQRYTVKIFSYSKLSICVSGWGHICQERDKVRHPVIRERKPHNSLFHG